MAAIITTITSITTWFFSLFSDLFDAITSNDYLLFSIIFGFAVMGVMLVIRVVKKVRKV